MPKLKHPSAAHSDRPVEALTIRGGTEVVRVLLREPSRLSRLPQPCYKIAGEAMHQQSQVSARYLTLDRGKTSPAPTTSRQHSAGDKNTDPGALQSGFKSHLGYLAAVPLSKFLASVPEVAIK